MAYKKTVRISAPCKLNLHLRVLDKRADGYHDIESIFQLVSLADELELSLTGSPGECTVISPEMALPPDNTISKAVSEFRYVTGIRDGLSVVIRKRIPSGAGLGGGSSDAAAVLRALDLLFGTDLDRSCMLDMAAKIGSDVPFFLSGAAGIVEGRGEKIISIPSRTDIAGLLVWPAVHSSTAAAYRLLDEWQKEGGEKGIDWPLPGELEKLYNRPVSEWPFRNSFTAPLSRQQPVIGEIRDALLNAGAQFSDMTGSGSAVFGLFENRHCAKKAQEHLFPCYKNLYGISFACVLQNAVVQ
ncbi:4-(cytidine 5'-diphospho)-2-C-methyl-D-erythritol kinase [Brucepastera parasyntrophica]|uniref:4-(cytidine 5'-diphospho)-2-C-methyl-D-erythritol kinase n=1 Tax=Brucepastera parasyntrophica TaxID=2880008 RepID=UPI00210B7C76|nr:4-(cytidine 5'-diphospho)-2-C-methyl-D-erythritol kinase [Brucepastera parasyntrophica]ULQ60485.1 4-(cytidine 5'-diphospho)-2-C-methyl-D-erythritol kinase [Brucepastera parasyntrophica]